MMRAWRDFSIRCAKRPRLVMAILSALLASQILPLWNPNPDGAGYLSIGRSIARGGPVTNMGSPKLHYPPGYPLLISPLFVLGDRPLVALLVLQWLLAVVFMLGTYRWARRWFPGGELWITALAMANIGLWLHARSTLSEIPFMALLIWTANAMDRLVAAITAREAAKWSALVSLMTVALAMIRPVGVLLVCGYGVATLVQAWQGRMTWPRAIGTTLLIGSPAALAILALLAYEAHTSAIAETHGQATYLHEFKSADVSLAAQLVEGVRLRSSEIGRLLVPGMFKSYAPPFQWLNLNMLIYAPLVGGLSWAWWRATRAGPSVLVFMVPWYVALYVAYPSDQGARYLLPLLPMLVVCLWWLVCQVPRHRVPLLSALVAAHLLVAMGYSALVTARLISINAEWPDADALADLLRDDPRAIVLWHAPPEARDLVMVAADRYVGEGHGQGEVPPQVELLLAAAAAPDCPGFGERARAGNLKLLERIDRMARAPASGSGPYREH